MSFFRTLHSRAKEEELMDDFTMGGEELHEALRHLRRLNKLFAASGPTVSGVAKLWESIGKPDKLTLMDVGAGSGDVNQRLLKWAKKQGIDMHITLVDMTEEACQEARQLFQNEPRVRVQRADLTTLPDASADIVTGSQFIHHFEGEQLVSMVGHMLRTSRYGVVINDIHRHTVSYKAVWITTRLISRNRYIRHDGPLSVAKGFTGQDWQELRQRLNHETMTYEWKPLFRFSVVIPHSRSREGQ